MKDNLYIWFDTEYSGLDLDTAVLLQVAAIITDASLRRVLPRERDVSLAIRLSSGIAVSAWVEQSLPDLLKACRSSAAVDVSVSDTLLSAYVDAAQGVPKDRKGEGAILAGNSIHADWWLARRFLPRFLSRLNYRLFDVTAFKLEWKRLHPDAEFQKENREMIRAYFPEATLNLSSRHDAHYDVEASIAEMGFYRKHLLLQEP
jgi:oligoribonuclease (3'-5' exoribonuclease)